ncbi:unnamed protein product [Sphenostylis stenocarpa]|uniref:Uncharacterized protein n=1 Tax=Sphenostylis stenocarpa TaxID=92480 RepID=A0AA86V8N3_9FABA|nr:unnamed protein product [Sphenostylis stenocarpa]
MLLQPSNSMEGYCQNLKLNIDDTEPKSYYFCESWLKCIMNPPLVSTFRNQRRGCGKLLNRMMRSLDLPNLEIGFVNEYASFLVSDDLYIMPNVFRAGANLFLKVGIEDMEKVEELTVDITKEVVDLLKFSLISRTPITDLILSKKNYLGNFIPINQNQFEIEKLPSGKGRQMVAKIQIRISNGKILFALAEEELKVPLSDLEERVITIGVKEGLVILKASLTSIFALSEGLKHFIRPIQEEWFNPLHPV